jgi:Xaa-Pro aminopeptidase
MNLAVLSVLPKNMTTENVGSAFNLDLYLKARAQTIEAVQKTAARIKPGMTEAEGVIVLNDELKALGIEKFWHPTKFRMNSNTTKNFRDTSEDVVLKDSDLFFIDIGPVFYNHEGDYGETFVIGNDEVHLKLKEATKTIFNKTQEAWKTKKLTGAELYAFAAGEAEKYHLKLNTNMYGHRLGDFPHALHFKGKLGSLDFSPAVHLWVLEIHLLDEKNNRGAFFEDILQ